MTLIPQKAACLVAFFTASQNHLLKRADYQVELQNDDRQNINSTITNKHMPPEATNHLLNSIVIDFYRIPKCLGRKLLGFIVIFSEAVIFR